MPSSTFSSDPFRAFLARLASFCAFFLAICVLVEASDVHLRWVEPRLADLQKAQREGVEVVLFGSSVNRFIANDDRDRRSIDELLQSRLGDLRVAGISADGFDAGYFESYVRYLLRRGYHPDLLIVPVNLRTFSVSWFMRPEFQLGRRRAKASGFPLWERLESILGVAPDVLTQDEYLDFEFSYRGEPRSIRENEESFAGDQSKIGFANAYLYDLDRRHPLFRSLENIGELATAAGVQVLYYLTPVDVERGSEVFADFRDVTRTHASEVVEALSRYGRVLDLSTDLPSSSFRYRVRPNEHMNIDGRSYVAEALAKEVRVLVGLGTTAAPATSVQSSAVGGSRDRRAVEAP